MRSFGKHRPESQVAAHTLDTAQTFGAAQSSGPLLSIITENIFICASNLFNFASRPSCRLPSPRVGRYIGIIRLEGDFPLMSRRRRTPRVLLLVETSRGYGRGILQGITQYAQEHGPWATCFEERGLEEPPPGWLKDWQGEGIISRTATKEVAKAIQATGLPVVELLGDFRSASAHVHPDNALVGRIAVEHLVDQGLRNFAYFAFGESYWIRLPARDFGKRWTSGVFPATYTNRSTLRTRPSRVGPKTSGRTYWTGFAPCRCRSGFSR